MKISEAEKYIRQGLDTIYEADECSNIARLVLEECTGYNRTQLLLNRHESLPEGAADSLKQILHRLQQHEPVQYVLNKAWFYNMELYVDRNVLIPRPETEELVNWITTDVNASRLNASAHNINQSDATNQLKILDIGTGSGCIPLALKKALPVAEVWGCDISEAALNVARRNGAVLNIRVDFQAVNILDETQQLSLPSFDIIVSNPPYIPLSDRASMQPNVLEYEPHTALFVPNDDALLFYKAIAAFAKKRLYPEGDIYFEIHEELGNAVAELLQKEGFENVTVRKDMQGKDRMVKATTSMTW